MIVALSTDAPQIAMKPYSLASLCASVLLVGSSLAAATREVHVQVDTQVAHQEIQGWGIPLFFEERDRMGASLQLKLIELFTRDMGCNGYRWEINRRDWEDYANDNDDPDTINWEAFDPATCDERALGLVLPMKKIVEARGEKLWLYSSSSFFYESESGTIPGWMLQSPAETSEWLVAHLLYVKQKYGITIDHVCVANEPDNHNRWDAWYVGNAVKELGPRLKRAGLATTIMFPEHAAVNGALDYIRRWQDDPGVMDYVSCFGYHLYFDTSYDNAGRREIARIARKLGKTVAQTEFMGADFGILYEDLVNGGVSFWYLYLDRDYISWTPDRTSFTLKQNYWDIRQVLHYVRPGSLRIDASTDSPEQSRVLGFKRGADVVLICDNRDESEAAKFRIFGLPAGHYGINQGTTELGVRTVGGDGRLEFMLSPGAVATIYPTHGLNQAPFPSSWGAAPSFLHLPEGSTTLHVKAADPEGDAMAYNWTVLEQPGGANVTIAKPEAAATSVSGLNVPGDYGFAVAISDGTNTVTQQLVPVRVVAGNQPPVFFELATRKSIFLQVPGITRTTLSCAAYDPESDPLTLRWSLVRHPDGAEPALANPDQRRCEVTNMNVAGEYQFRIEASDAQTTVAREITVTVRPANHAPEITSIAAEPDAVAATSGRTRLIATTADNDGDNLGIWWSVRSSPPGAHPMFSHRGHRETEVSGLTIPGTYVFEIVAADNTERAFCSVSVEVAPAPTAER